MVDAALVFCAALATALATGLGALPFASRRLSVRSLLGPANAVASGVMLGASASLVIEGGRIGATRTLAGACAGAAFVSVAKRGVSAGKAHELGGLRGVDARKGLLIVVVMTVHSVAEGVGVGAAFGGGAAFGVLIALAIAVHNIPEGLAISLVLVPRGTRVRTAAFWSVFSSLPQPAMALPAYFFVAVFASALPVALGFAAGAMIWLAARELLPDALRQAPGRVVALDAACAFAAMLALQLLLL